MKGAALCTKLIFKDFIVNFILLWSLVKHTCISLIVLVVSTDSASPARGWGGSGVCAICDDLECWKLLEP